MKKQVTRFTRLCFGLLAITAILTEIIVTVTEGSFSFFNFFGFFTILSNLAAGILLIYLSFNAPSAYRLQALRGAITLYMLMTGVIFAILLAGLENVRLTAVPWDNIVLHYIMPTIVVLDWVINPPVERVSIKAAASWLIFPIIYITYTLIRGAFVGWYPYPFLNPNLSSYSQVVSSCLALTIFVLISVVLLRLVKDKNYK